MVLLFDLASEAVFALDVHKEVKRVARIRRPIKAVHGVACKGLRVGEQMLWHIAVVASCHTLTRVLWQNLVMQCSFNLVTPGHSALPAVVGWLAGEPDKDNNENIQFQHTILLG